MLTGGSEYGTFALELNLTGVKVRGIIYGMRKKNKRCSVILMDCI